MSAVDQGQHWFRATEGVIDTHCGDDKAHPDEETADHAAFDRHIAKMAHETGQHECHDEQRDERNDKGQRFRRALVDGALRKFTEFAPDVSYLSELHVLVFGVVDEVHALRGGDWGIDPAGVEDIAAGREISVPMEADLTDAPAYPFGCGGLPFIENGSTTFKAAVGDAIEQSLKGAERDLSEPWHKETHPFAARSFEPLVGKRLEFDGESVVAVNEDGQAAGPSEFEIVVLNAPVDAMTDIFLSQVGLVACTG